MAASNVSESEHFQDETTYGDDGAGLESVLAALRAECADLESQIGDNRRQLRDIYARRRPVFASLANIDAAKQVRLECETKVLKEQQPSVYPNDDESMHLIAKRHMIYAVTKLGELKIFLQSLVRDTQAIKGKVMKANERDESIHACLREKLELVYSKPDAQRQTEYVKEVATKVGELRKRMRKIDAGLAAFCDENYPAENGSKGLFDILQALLAASWDERSPSQFVEVTDDIRDYVDTLLHCGIVIRQPGNNKMIKLADPS